MTPTRFILTATVLAAMVVLGTQRSQAQVYNTTWSDEFNGAYGSPNTTNWSMDTGNNNGWGNNNGFGFFQRGPAPQPAPQTVNPRQRGGQYYYPAQRSWW